MSPHDRRRRRPQHDNHVSPVTRKRRVPHGLSESQVGRAKRLRDVDLPCVAIADELHCETRNVELALAASRSPNPQSSYASIFTNKPTLARFREQELPGETRHQTLLRLLDEHAHFQRLVLG